MAKCAGRRMTALAQPLLMAYFGAPEMPRRRPVNQRIDEVFRTRPRAESRSRVDVPGLAQIDECRAPVAGKRARTVGRHPRIVFAADDDRRGVDAPAIELLVHAEAARVRRRN